MISYNHENRQWEDDSNDVFIVGTLNKILPTFETPEDFYAWYHSMISFKDEWESSKKHWQCSNTDIGRIVSLMYDQYNKYSNIRRISSINFVDDGRVVLKYNDGNESNTYPSLIHMVSSYIELGF